MQELVHDVLTLCIWFHARACVNDELPQSTENWWE
jgi:hypothetical protein